MYKGGVDLWVLNSIKAILILQWKGCRMEAVSCATKEDAEKSIEENEQDWKIYFGVKEK